MGWRILVLERTEVATLFVIASIREAINRLLPVANVGGEVVGARLLVRRGVSYAAAVSSILVETILNIRAHSDSRSLSIASCRLILMPFRFRHIGKDTLHHRGHRWRCYSFGQKPKSSAFLRCVAARYT